MTEQEAMARAQLRESLMKKTPGLSGADATVLVDMSIKLKEDIDAAFERALDQFTPLMGDVSAKLVAPFALSDMLSASGYYYRGETLEALKELADISGKTGLAQLVETALRRRRGEQE